MTGLALREPELLSSLHDAARRCGRRKQNRRDVVAYRLREGEVLLHLAARIADGSYVPAPGRVFVTQRPKHREIHAAPYSDRIVHHLLHGLLAPHFEARFIADSFACRPGRGTHAAARRLWQQLWDVTRHGQVRAYALQLDIRSFFPSLHRPTLLSMLRPVAARLPPLARDRRGLSVLELTRRVVEHDATQAVRVGPARAFASVPRHKRLGAQGPDTGLPIGNLTSQFFANVYLDVLDRFIKRGLGVRYYVRYVDDLVLLDQDPARLRAARDAVSRFCQQRLRLQVHPGAEPFPVSRGVDFVGYVVRPGYSLPRRRVVRAFHAKLDAVLADLPRATIGPGERAHLAGLGWVTGPLRLLRVDGPVPERLRATWSSYEGHFAHASAFRLRTRAFQRSWLIRRLLLRRGSGVALRYPPAAPSRSFAAQRAGLARSASGAALLIRVGRRVLLPVWAGRRLGLTPSKRCGARYSVAQRRAARTAVALLALGCRVAVAVERPWPHGAVKRRELRYLLEPVRGQRRAPPSQGALP